MNRSRQQLKASNDYNSRLRFIKLVTIVWAGLLIARLFTLQFLYPERWLEWAEKQHVQKIQLAGERARILDRHGKVMAVSVPTSSVFLRPEEVQDEEAIAMLAAEYLEIRPDIVRTKLKTTKPFVWLKRQVPRHVAKELYAKQKGLGVITESKRYYPYAEAASTLIGKVGIDGNGLSGLEARFEKTLNAKKFSYQVHRDALGKKIHQAGPSSEGLSGNDIALTIDTELQQICNRELHRVLEEHQAKSAIAVLINAEQGEVLSLAQAPTANFNANKIKSRKDLMNIAAQAVYEPGSTFKPIVTALALEQEVVDIEQVFDTEDGRYRVGRHFIKDVHASEELSVADIVIHSSNIGMSKIAEALGKEKLYDGLRAFGFGRSTNLNLPGEGAGILRKASTWAQVDLATHSFGQGVAVTPLQLVRAFASLVNGGYLTDLQIVQGEKSFAREQLISPANSKLMRQVLIDVVESPEGTGSHARIPGLTVGGKTGTAQKARTDGRGYQKDAYLASFLGFADGTAVGIDQQLVLLVMVDEPRAGSIYGGTVAAPVFKRILEKSFYVLGLRENLADQREPQARAHLASY